jgi:hypothetical protein
MAHKTLYLTGGLHDWQKQNLITKKDKRGFYDDYKCANCGALGKRRGFVEFIETPLSTYLNCPKGKTLKVPTKIKITFCNGSGVNFSNLTPGSEHFVITPPKGYLNDSRGVWVNGVYEPVKVLSDEFNEIILVDLDDLDF